MTERTITIPSINLQSMVVSIVGVTPLLTNRFSEESVAKIEDKQQHRAKVARDPKAEFKAAAPMIAPDVYEKSRSGPGSGESTTFMVKPIAER